MRQVEGYYIAIPFNENDIADHDSLSLFDAFSH